MIKRNIYKWHRWLSAIIAIPVIMWTVSGIMHPIMTSSKPKIKDGFLKSEVIDTTKINITLENALHKNGIAEIINFRIVKINQQHYYQVKLKDKAELIYFNTTNGDIYKNGDIDYAIQLAKKILGDTNCKVKETSLVENFEEEYVYVNRLLPVYKVSFDRNDGIRIYVDTYGSRMALAMNDSRRAFNIFFVSFHSFGFLPNFINLRIFILTLLSIISFLTAIMGIYIWVIIPRKKKPTHNKAKQRKWHSKIAIVTSITTLLFTFSGAFHAFEKFTPDTRQNYFYETEIKTELLNPSFKKIDSALANKQAICNMAIVKMDSNYYWQVSQNGNKGELFKSYIDAKYYRLLKNGDERYASFLANKFSGNNNSEIQSTKQLTKFESEYGFVNKRLPVVKVQYKKNDNERYYIETSTGKLSVKVQDKDLLEGYSFAMFHKYHFMDFLGKTQRDALTVITAMANLLVTILGIVLLVRYFKKRN